ncbi:MAG: glucan biosynthesis protein G [Amphiplicatus sp.]
MLHPFRPEFLAVSLAVSFAATTLGYSQHQAQRVTASPPIPSLKDRAEATASPSPPAERGKSADAVFSRARVVSLARALAREPFRKPANMAPKSAAELTYDQYHRIEFKRDSADWRQTPNKRFRIHYDVQGYLFNTPIAVNLVQNGQSRPRPYRPEDFNFFDLPLSPEDIRSLAFAGFHLTTPMNKSGKFDDLINFRGASFLRVLGAGVDYGASARGLAVNTASPAGEEFPAFREFWIEDPGDGDTITIHALLDSPNLAGAYTFVVTPGSNTIVDVVASVFPRTTLTNVGVAPVSSMFDFAPHDQHPARRDVRPRVHDSEGLLIHLRSGEWAWRPLINPDKLEFSVFANQPPLGFGLFQRDRDPADYQDLEARYETRPSVWITPRSKWGPGKLTLIEIPTENEFNDNIVLFWKPDAPWKAGGEINFAYRMAWGLSPRIPPVASVGQSRAGRSLHNDSPFYLIDFDTAGIGGEASLAPSVSTSAGVIRNVNLMENPVDGGMRLTFELDPGNAAMAELRANLTRAGEPVSETWLFRWRPQ